jgi:hypothetical protein
VASTESRSAFWGLFVVRLTPFVIVAELRIRILVDQTTLGVVPLVIIILTFDFEAILIVIGCIV